MIKGLASLIFIAAFGFFINWLAQNSGQVTFEAFGYRVEIAFVVFSIMLILTIFFFQFLTGLILKLSSIPEAIRHKLSDKRKETLTHSLIDFIFATKQSSPDKLRKTAQKLSSIKELPSLQLYMQYVIAKADSAVEEMHKLLFELTTFPETKSFALQELYNLSAEKGDWQIALNYAEELYKNCADSSSISSMVQALINTDAATDAIKFLKKFKVSHHLTTAQHQNLLTIAYYTAGKEAFSENNFTKAIDNLKQAFEHYSSSHVAYLLAAAYAKNKDKSKMISVISKAWKNLPSSLLTELLITELQEYTPEKFFSVAKSIAANNPKHHESYVLLAKAALEADQFDNASNNISELLSQNKSIRAALLMAAFCTKTHGSLLEINNWLNVALLSQSKNYCNTLNFNYSTLKFDDRCAPTQSK